MPSQSLQKKENKIAIIDIGTNTLILLIARLTGSKMQVLHDEAIITRLGQGISQNHFFISEAMARTLAALKKFKAICDHQKVSKIIAVGTAACRNAANANVFLNNVKKECGFKVKVISGEDEAEATFSAASRDFKKNKIIVVDIGGGSTEIIESLSTNKKTAISLPIGSVKLTEQYIRHDPIQDEEYQILEKGIDLVLQDEMDSLFEENYERHTLIATAGTAATLATLDRKLKKYVPEKVHGYELTQAHLQKIIVTLKALSVKDRTKLPGMEPLRADVILAGSLLLSKILTYFSKESCLVSDRGLRYGVLYQYL